MANEPKKYPNPAPLGLAGFALTTWLLSMINAGWFSGGSINLVLACALSFGGTAQMIAGVMEVPRGNTFGATAFVSYGAFWWSFALFVLFLHDKVPSSFVGWYLCLWGVFTFYMWLGTFRSPKVLQLVFLALWMTFGLLAGSEWLGSTLLHEAGGYLGMVTGALAFYLSAAEMLAEAYGRAVIPVGHPRPSVALSRWRGRNMMR